MFKRKSEYIDRGKQLSESSKKVNVMSNVVVRPCSAHFKLTESLFHYSLSVPETSDTAIALVLLNEVCVLVLSDEFFRKWEGCMTISLQFPSSITTNKISGKRKKGAQVLKAGSVICSILVNGEQLIGIRTPVGGQLLEVNDDLLLNSNLEEMKLFQKYIAIIYPNTKIPTLEHPNVEDLRRHNPNVCHGWLNGKCKYGDKCKFEHVVQEK
jgi:hypothetical protein